MTTLLSIGKMDLSCSEFNLQAVESVAGAVDMVTSQNAGVAKPLSNTSMGKFAAPSISGWMPIPERYGQASGAKHNYFRLAEIPDQMPPFKRWICFQ